MRKVSLLLLIPLGAIFLILSQCGKSAIEAQRDDYGVACGMAYKTSDIYFKESDVLTFKLRFIYFADSIGEREPDYGVIIQGANKFYQSSGIQFVPYSGGSFSTKIVNSDMKADMPSFIKYHLNYFKNDSVITMYIYGDDQPNYAADMKNVAGSAGGIGSNFFAVRRRYIYEPTVWHELGHCFFLMHPSEPDPTQKGLSLMYGDKVCDLIKSDPIVGARPDTCYVQNGWNPYTQEEINDLICNIMSGTMLNCRKCITQNQRARMRFYIHESPAMRMALVE